MHHSGQIISADRKGVVIQCSCDLAANSKADCQSSINTMHEGSRNPMLMFCPRMEQISFLFVLYGCRPDGNHQCIAGSKAGPFVFIHFFSSLAAGHVIVVRVCFDSLISRLTSLINIVVSACRWNDIKWPIHVLICGQQAFSQHTFTGLIPDVSNKKR